VPDWSDSIGPWWLTPYWWRSGRNPDLRRGVRFYLCNARTRGGSR
jgi:hypothetical protein